MGVLSVASVAHAGPYQVMIAKPTLAVRTVQGSTPESTAPTTRPQLQLTASQGLTFGSLKVGQTAQRGFVLQNSGDATAAGVAVNLSGAGLTTVANNCGSAQSPGTLAAGASCAVTVQWAPTSEGPLAGTLGVTASNVANAPASLTLTGSATAADTHSGNLGLLLHFDGAPGATSFVDSSPAPVTGTAVGSGALTNAFAKFGGSSLASGTNSYASFPWKASYTLNGSYTVEAWVYLREPPATDQGGGTCGTIAAAGAWTAQSGWQFYYCHNSGIIGFGSSGNGAAQIIATYAMPLNQWTHIAVVRDGSANAVYVNGTSRPLTQNSFTAQTVSSGILTVGSERRFSGWNHDFPGYIDELRITNGVARYTGNFTAPTAAFPNP